MFDNIGGKLKGLAKIITVLGIIISVIYGISLIVTGISQRAFLVVLLGVLLMIGGSIISWALSLGLYAFGELVENSKVIADWTRSNKVNDFNSNTQSIQESAEKGNTAHQFKCKICGARITSHPCPNCGYTGTPDSDDNSGKSVTPIYLENKKIKCPKCGQTQLNNRTYCYNCGIVFEHTTHDE